MTRVWFAEPLETVATFWRVLRRDGAAMGFTTHDADVWLDGVLHSTAPGMVPSAIRRSGDFEADSAEVTGALSHDSIDADDLIAGRYDGAAIVIGLVDWVSGESQVLYRGAIGTVSEEAGQFTATLQSRKAELQRDPIPRTSPTCRAEFCGRGCGLSGARFTHEAVVDSIDAASGSLTASTPAPDGDLVGGEWRWLDGPYAGLRTGVVNASAGTFQLDAPLDRAIPAGTRALVREGCDRTLETCATRFANAANFQGEPFLPGNDLIARYPAPSQ